MNTKIIKQDSQHKHYDAMVIAVLPLIVASSVMFGARVILLSIIALITARVVDVFSSMIFNTELDTSDKSSIVAGLVFVLMLPVSIPIHIIVVTIAVTVFIGKHAFGGNGYYPFSLSALAICIAAVNWPEEVFKVVQPFTKVEMFSGEAADFATHTTVIKQGGLPNVSLIDMLLGNYASAMGTSFILVIFAIGIYLIVTKRISFIIPLSYLFTYTLMALLFPRIYGISLLDNLTLEVLTGGCVFYAFFVISEPALTPKGKIAQGVYGVLAGILGMLFTYYGEYEIGVCFAILILNAMQRVIEDGVVYINLFIKNSKSRPVKSKVVKDTIKTHIPKKEENLQETIIENKNIETEIKIEPKSEVKADIKVKSEIKEELPLVQRGHREKQFPIDLIQKAEDDIDEVIFSTQTFSVQELLDETRKAKSEKTKKAQNENIDRTPRKPRTQKQKSEDGQKANSKKSSKPKPSKTAKRNPKTEKPKLENQETSLENQDT